MGIYLGQAGCVELQRTSAEGRYKSEVAQSDVNDTVSRFSFDFSQGQFLTGDLVEIRAIDGGLLDFVDASGWQDGNQHPDGMWFVFVDIVGSMRLYRTFDEAIAGELQGRVQLLVPTRTIPITVSVRNNFTRILGQVTTFEINTEREAVDVTELGESFRKQYSGLISGSGRVECFFEYDNRMCDEIPNDAEVPAYMNQLILRSQIGSEFGGRFTLVSRGIKPDGGTQDLDDEVWYELKGVITNVSMAFEPTQPVRVAMSFVTTGEIRLRIRTISNYLLQEDYDRLSLEPYQDGFIEVEQRE